MQIEGANRQDLNQMVIWDNEGNEMHRVKWYNGGGQWHYITIPEGKEIIGFYCNTEDHSSDLRRLGFMLWEPPGVDIVL